MASHPDFAKQWLAQRATGTRALVEIERAELVALDDETALRHIEAALSMPLPPLSDERRTSSGFVEQQRIFLRGNSRARRSGR